jgi:hypothetical protein
MNERPHFRIGEGWDVHALVPGRPLVIGGVTIPHPVGLLGHSDADVLLHALTDALLGAAGLGDIGSHFPDTDAAFPRRRLRCGCWPRRCAGCARPAGGWATWTAPSCGAGTAPGAAPRGHARARSHVGDRHRAWSG